MEFVISSDILSIAVKRSVIDKPCPRMLQSGIRIPQGWQNAGGCRSSDMRNKLRQTPRAVCKTDQNQASLDLYFVYEPTAWDSDTFINHVNPIQKDKAVWIEQRIRDLKNEVRVMLNSTSDTAEKLKIVDTIEHLGLGYHFKREIDDSLSYLHDAKLDSCDLYNVATRFRLLRQHGFDVSSDEFLIFKDGMGNFDEKLKKDPKGLLSMYNAGYLAIPGEETLADAISFARGHLTSIASCLKSPLKKQVLRALRTPLHKMMNRVEARFYIEEYEEEEGRNEILLELAKLDFNLVQSLHLEEMKNLSLWWKELNIRENLQYARDRLLESYTFWGMGLYFEPQYSRARIMLSKIIALGTIMDDIYDVYGVYEDCKLLNDAIQRWDEKAADSLPVHLQSLFLKFINTFNSYEDELEPNEKYRFPYLIESIQTFVNGYFQEVEWRTANHVPTFDERKIPALDGNADCIACVGPFIGMPEEVIAKEMFQWLNTRPPVVIDCMSICRYTDEFISFERETKSEQGPTTFECYMIEHNLTREEATVKFQSFSDEAWKRLNRACFWPTKCPMPVFERLVNQGRMLETMYVYFNDGFNKSSNLKDIIALLLLKPFSL